MPNKKILFLIAYYGFQPLEYGGTREELEKAGLQVVVGSNQKGVALGKDNITEVKVDLMIDDIVIGDYDGLYLIGGQGALACLDNEKTHDLLKQWQNTGKSFGAICISTRILAKAGVLQGKTATGWNFDGELPEILVQNGAIYSADDVHRDGNIITASGPMSPHDFGLEIVKAFK